MIEKYENYKDKVFEKSNGNNGIFNFKPKEETIIPIASTQNLGMVRIGTGLSVNSAGTISVYGGGTPVRNIERRFLLCTEGSTSIGYDAPFVMESDNIGSYCDITKGDGVSEVLIYDTVVYTSQTELITFYSYDWEGEEGDETDVEKMRATVSGITGGYMVEWYDSDNDTGGTFTLLNINQSVLLEDDGMGNWIWAFVMTNNGLLIHFANHSMNDCSLPYDDYGGFDIRLEKGSIGDTVVIYGEMYRCTDDLLDIYNGGINHNWELYKHLDETPTGQTTTTLTIGNFGHYYEEGNGYIIEGDGFQFTASTSNQDADGIAWLFMPSNDYNEYIEGGDTPENLNSIQYFKDMANINEGLTINEFFGVTSCSGVLVYAKACPYYEDENTGEYVYITEELVTTSGQTWNMPPTVEECWECEGTGVVDYGEGDETCQTCEGSGWISTDCQGNTEPAPAPEE